MARVSWKFNLVMLWLSQLAVLAGFAAFVPFIPLFIKNELGVTDHGALVSAVAAFNFFGSLAYAVFNPVWGKLADRFGVKLMLLRGTFLTAAIFPLMAYSRSVAMLVFLRFLSAACAGTAAASQMMVVRNTPECRQGFALGVLSSAFWGGSVCGFVIGGVLIHSFSYEVAFWLCGILYFCGGIAILFTRDTDLRMPRVRHRFRSHGLAGMLPRFTRSVWIMLTLFLVLGFIRNFEAAYTALRIEEIVGKERAVLCTGLVSAGVALGAILSGILSGTLVDRIPVNKLLWPIMTTAAASLVVQGAAQTLWGFSAGRILLYVAAAGLQPILQKLLSAVTSARKRGSVFGFASTCQCCGGMIAFVAGGVSMYFLNLSGVFYMGALFFLLALPLFLHLLPIAVSAHSSVRRA